MWTVTKTVAALALSAASILAVSAPAAAYTPVGTGDSVTLAGGASETFRFDELTPGGPVRAALTGADVTADSLAHVRIAASTASVDKTASATGDVDVRITLPEEAEGTYVLLVRDQTTGAEQELRIHAAVTFEGTIPATGLDGHSPLALWAAGGGLLLVGAGIAVATSVRRARQSA